VSDVLHRLFQHTYRELRPRAEMPGFRVSFYPFANINNTIRLRQGKLLVRLRSVDELDAFANAI